jgi:Carboxypeptidase regulatory-like domain
MTKRTLLAIILALCTVALGTSAAQKKKNRDDSNTRVVQGTVTDADNNALNGAVVQLKDTKTLQVRSFYTQQNGDYHFAGLSTNVDYELKAEKDGASSSSKTLSVFDSRKTAVINLKLDHK